MLLPVKITMIGEKRKKKQAVASVLQTDCCLHAMVESTEEIPCGSPPPPGLALRYSCRLKLLPLRSRRHVCRQVQLICMLRSQSSDLHSEVRPVNVSRQMLFLSLLAAFTVHRLVLRAHKTS